MVALTQKTMTKTQEKTTADSETYSRTPGSVPLKSKTGNFETDFSNK